MKRFLVLLAAVGVVAACSNKTANTTEPAAEGKKVYYTTSAADAANARNAKYQIIDQEFDNMLAPESDYDTLSADELQTCGSTYVPPATKLKKPQAKEVEKTVKASVNTTTPVTVNKNKKVTNTTNIYYVDGPAPKTPAKSSTTTTTYASDGSVISTTSN